MKRRAFTLIEILIVVAIIGILLGIALPAWVQVRKKSWETVRKQNCFLIDRAKEQWIQEKGQIATATPDASNLSPEYIDPFPSDPKGTYVINAGNVPCVFIEN